MSELAYVGLDRQVHVLGPGGSRQLSQALPRPAGGWTLGRGPADAWSWPTWSPDGGWVAAFAAPAAEGGAARLVALATDGIREEEWAELPHAAPLYAQWHPSGRAIAVLAQHQQELVASVVRRDRLGQVRPVEHGVPLFYNWNAEGSRLLLHVGAGQGPGRLVLRDPLGEAADVVYDRAPGSFCSPIFVGDRAVYAVGAGESASEVASSTLDGEDLRVLGRRRGLLALVPGPSPWVAVSAAPKGEGSPYRGVDLLDVYTGEKRVVTRSDCLAFFWFPDGKALLLVRVEPEENCLAWFRVPIDGGDEVKLATFWPTRDFLFFLHFFEQYARSHSLFSADGQRLVFAGYPAGRGQADLSEPPRIYCLEVAVPHSAEEIARGSFAVYAPRGPA